MNTGVIPKNIEIKVFYKGEWIIGSRKNDDFYIKNSPGDGYISIYPNIKKWAYINTSEQEK